MNVHDYKRRLTNVEKHAVVNMGLECNDLIVWSKNASLKKEDEGRCVVCYRLDGTLRSRCFYDFTMALDFTFLHSK
jgi:hypothetical protein